MSLQSVGTTGASPGKIQDVFRKAVWVKLHIHKQ